MPSQQILPITHKPAYPSYESPPSSTSLSISALTHTMLLKENDPTTRLLISTSFDDEKTAPIQPLLHRVPSYSSITSTTSKQKRHRRTASGSSFSSQDDDASHQSLSREVGHAAAETFLVTRLSLKLLKYLGLKMTLLREVRRTDRKNIQNAVMRRVGYRWITRFLALGCYAFLLMPGFIQVGYYYFFSRQVKRSIVYGDQPRNRMDLYLPKNIDGPKPVIAFITGGAWIIGYKAWGSLLGQQLSDRDIIVACIDYRNFPQGTIRDMVNDASDGISFVCNHIAEYGGDPNRVYLMGQSAGAHIAACVLVEQAIKEAGEGENITWSVSQIKTYFGLSGGYNLLELVDYFHSRGLYRRIFLSIMEGEESLRSYSPEIVIQDPNIRNAASLLPPIVLFHGTADYSIPSDARYIYLLCSVLSDFLNQF